VGTAASGKSEPMTQPGQDDDPAASMEREADALEHHLEQLDDHIADAHKAADARREEALPEAAAGDWEETRGAPGQGEDPEGAVGDHGTDAGATEADATSDADADADADDAATDSSGEAPSASRSDDASDGGEDSGGDAPAQRDDPVGSRMPGHASGGDD
jgi:hypothetical protein